MLSGFDRHLIVATIFTFKHGKHLIRHQSSETSRTDFSALSTRTTNALLHSL